MDITVKTEDKGHSPLIERLFSVGAHFGYSRSRRHPSMGPYLFGAKNRVELFDLEKVARLLEKACGYMEELGRARRVFLLVGGKHEARSIIVRAAEDTGMPYVAGRWIGGTLTNFAEISKRIRRLEDLREQRASGELESKYTKRERLMIDREIDSLKENFDGLTSLKELPAALLIVDSAYERTAVREAQALGIPIVALVNSDGDAHDATYPIAANDSASKSIAFFIDELITAYKRGMMEAPDKHTDGGTETPEEK